MSNSKEKEDALRKSLRTVVYFLIILYMGITILTHVLSLSSPSQVSLHSRVVPPLASPSDAVSPLEPAVKEPREQSVTESSGNPVESPADVIRKTQVARGSDYTLSIFYSGGKEIARESISADGEHQQSGVIPDGKVRFYDEYNQMYGEEYYSAGKKDGPAKTYFNDGRLKSETKYGRGQLLTIKEYYADGQLRFQADYSEAIDDPNNKEVGAGKLYYPDGHLKYEWNLTRGNYRGFKKSYNTDGSLRAEIYFDAQGQMLESGLAK